MPIDPRYSGCDLPGDVGVPPAAAKMAALPGAFLHPSTGRSYHIQMHEFEGLLFREPTRFAESIGCSHLAPNFLKIRSDFPTPEWINDHPETAPSKRIQHLFHACDKPDHPVLATLDMGLNIIRQECPLFDRWVKRLEALPSGFSAH